MNYFNMKGKNVSTDLKHALIDSTFEYISANREQYNPGKIDKATKEVIIRRRVIVLKYAQKMLSWRMVNDERTLTYMLVGPKGVVKRSRSYK